MNKFLTKTKLSASAAASTAASTAASKSEIDEAILLRHNRRKRKAASIEIGEISCTTCFKSKSVEEFTNGRSPCRSCNADRLRKYRLDKKKCLQPKKFK